MVDSITVEVIRHSLLSIAQEMARNLCRTAYNTVVYEIHDYGIGLHDALFVVPITLLITGVALLVATRTFSADARAMRGEQAPRSAASGARAGSAA